MTWWIVAAIVNAAGGFAVGRTIGGPLTRAERRAYAPYLYVPLIASTCEPSSITRVTSEDAACSEDE